MKLDTAEIFFEAMAKQYIRQKDLPHQALERMLQTHAHGVDEYVQQLGAVYAESLRCLATQAERVGKQLP